MLDFQEIDFFVICFKAVIALYKWSLIYIIVTTWDVYPLQDILVLEWRMSYNSYFVATLSYYAMFHRQVDVDSIGNKVMTYNSLLLF